MALTAQQEIEYAHLELASLVKTFLPSALTVSIVSINGYDGGQMIICAPEHNKRIVAERLRRCAEILLSQADAAALKSKGGE